MKSNARKHPRSNKEMDNQEKLATFATKYKKQKTKKNKKTQTTYTKHEPSYEQLEVKTNRTSFHAEIVMELRM